MSQCRECTRSGWLVWTNVRGVCPRCDREMRGQVEAERDRVKEALIFAGVLKSPRDRSIHLGRAIDGVRALVRYEARGCGEIHPRPGELLKVLERRWEETRGETGFPPAAGAREQGSPEGAGRAGEEASSAATRGAVGLRQVPEPWERRRSTRHAAGAVDQVRVSGVRARAEDVSARGVRVGSPFVRRAGSRVELTFQTPAGRVAAQALVRWVLPFGAAQGGKGEMGLELLGQEAPLAGYLGKGAVG